MGNIVAWMEDGERAEVVPVAGGGVGHAGVAEQQREDGAEGGPDDERGHQAAGHAAKGGFRDVGHQLQADGCAGSDVRGCIAPQIAHRRQRGQVHGYIKCGDKEDREQDGAGNGPLRTAHLSAKEADVVVAPITVGRQQRGLRQAAERRR